MVAGEHQRDEHAGDLIGREPRSAILVLDRHQHIEHVAIRLVGGRVGDPQIHDFLNYRNEFQARLVTAFEALDGQVRIDVTQRIGAALQLVVILGEAVIELFAKLKADQAGCRCVDGQLGEEVE